MNPSQQSDILVIAGKLRQILGPDKCLDPLAMNLLAEYILEEVGRVQSTCSALNKQLQAAAARDAKLAKIEATITRILNQQGDDHCWRDIYTELAGFVNAEFKPRMLSKDHMLANCSHFIDCLQSGEHYITPQPEAVAIMAMVDKLRENEGASVTITCDNPDWNGLPARCILVTDNWTDWQERDFRADTLADCLKLALAEREKVIAQINPPLA